MNAARSVLSLEAGQRAGACDVTSARLTETCGKFGRKMLVALIKEKTNLNDFIYYEVSRREKKPKLAVGQLLEGKEM